MRLTQVGGAVARKLKGEMQTSFTESAVDYTVGLQVTDPFLGYVYESEEYFADPQQVPFETKYFPDELGSGKWKKQKKWATKKAVEQVKEQVNNLHTKREAIEWRSGLRVTDELQLYVHVGAEGVSREYLPDSKAVPFTTGASFDVGQWVQSELITQMKHWRDVGNVRGWGAVGDGVTDDSAAFQSALNLGGNIIGNAGDTYYISECHTKLDTSFDGRCCKLKYKRAAGDSKPWLPAQRIYTWNDGDGSHTTGQETMVDIRHNGFWKNFTVEGNGVPYLSSADYPNTMMSVFWVQDTNGLIFDNVHISENNANGITVYNSINFQFINGSIRNTHGLAGSITNQEQITILSSAYCRIANSYFGGYNPWSAINCQGGLYDISDGDEIGGWYSYKTGRPFRKTTVFGRRVGDTDGFHIVEGNIVTSEPAPNEALGGGVVGRNITINSCANIVRNNVCYNTATNAQGGIGLGHDNGGNYQPQVEASRTEVSGNIIAGYKASTNGIGIGNYGSEDCNVHDNFIYNCTNGIMHARYATNSVYDSNKIHYCVDGAIIGGINNNQHAHGVDKRIQFTNSHFINNTRHFNYTDGSGWTDITVKGCKFRDLVSTERMFYFNHGAMEFSGNHIITNSQADGIFRFYCQDTGSHVVVNNNVIICGAPPTADNHGVVIFDGASTNVSGGRGRLEINGLTVQSPDNGGFCNRRIQIQRATENGVLVDGFNLVNTYFIIADIYGDVSISDGKIDLQGSSSIGIIGNASDQSRVKMVKIDNITFPKVGAQEPINVSVTTGAGFCVISNCVTLEDKWIADDYTSSDPRYALHGNYKVSGGALIAAQA